MNDLKLPEYEKPSGCITSSSKRMCSYTRVAIHILWLPLLLCAAVSAEPETTTESPGETRVLAPVKDFNIRYNFDAEGKVQPGLMQESSDWVEADFGRPGKVWVEDKVLFIERGNDMTGVRWRGPLVRKDYELILDAMRVEGEDFFCGLTFPVGEDPCSLILGGWGGSLVGLSSIDYADAANNMTARNITFENNRWYRVRVRVYGEKNEAWLDDKKIVDLVTTNRQIGIRWEMDVCVPLGIATWQTTGAIRNMKYWSLTEKPRDYEVEK